MAVLAALAAAQAVYSVAKDIKATKDFNKAASQRTAFKTPEETYEILESTQANAQTGFDAETMNYITSESDRAFSASLGTTQAMGGDPNSQAALFDQKLQQIMKTAGQSQALKLEKFSQFLAAKDTVANSLAAEWSSRDAMLKDKMQAANANKQAAAANLSSAVNTGISAYAQAKMDNMYGDEPSGVGEEVSRKVMGSGRGSYTLGGADPTSLPRAIVRGGKTYTWNASLGKYL